MQLLIIISIKYYKNNRRKGSRIGKHVKCTEKREREREKGGSNRRSSGYGVIADIVVKIEYFCLVFVFVLESGHVVAID